MKDAVTRTTPAQVYALCRDKQRVIVTGTQARMLTSIIVFTLNGLQRSFDFVSGVPEDQAITRTRLTDSPVVIIHESDQPTIDTLDYQHHIVLLAEMPRADAVSFQLADATPKGGILIFSELPPTDSIGNKERPGVTTIPYKAYDHRQQGNGISLLTSKNEVIPVRISGQENLRNISGAKEVLKKLGVTSSQFYDAIARFQA